MKVAIEERAPPLARPFVIARGVQREAHVVLLHLEHEGVEAVGEAAPSWAVTRETPGSVVTFLERHREALEALDPDDAGGYLEDLHEGGGDPAARAAVDLALHDLMGKLAGRPVHALLDVEPGSLPTCLTVSLDAPDAMAAEAREKHGRGFRHLKVKLGDAAGDRARLRAVRDACPEAVLRVDANEGWTASEAADLLPELADLGVVLVEQPLPRADVDGLIALADGSPVPIFADECVHGAADVEDLAARGFRGGVNLKLMKHGGVLPTLAAARAARGAGLAVQLGCMIETGIAIAGAAHLLSLADHADLDGNLLLSRDPYPGVPRRGDVLESSRDPGLGVHPNPQVVG